MDLKGVVSVVARVEIEKRAITFGELAVLIGRFGGDITAIDVIQSGKEIDLRDITISLPASGDIPRLADELRRTEGIRLYHVSDRTFLDHLGGKIQIAPKIAIHNRDDLSRVYTPGVAKICMAIHENEEKSFALTIKRNMVAVVSDGTAVLGLGDIGPHAAMPVMEGKAMLFKQFAGVDAFPICLATKDTDELVRIIKAMAPTFGGINLEDIASPRCFEVERRLRDELDIPVFHDDQHGTAVVILAGLLNALKIVGKPIDRIKVVVCGIGAAGVSSSQMLLEAGVKNLIGVDKVGILHRGERYDSEIWNEYARRTNPHGEVGTLSDAVAGADVFIGVSRPNVLTAADVQRMASDPIVFAMANPEPEIAPEAAERHARIFATGRSDYPNQLNNVLVFPGIFRAALDCRARTINEPMKLAAARAIASIIGDDELNEHYVIPSVFNERVVKAVRKSVVEAALQTGVARRVPRDFRETATSL